MVGKISSPSPGANFEALQADDQLARAILRQLGLPVPSSPPDGSPRHKVAEPRRWPWLPTLDHGHLAPHAFCVHCGGVRYVGDVRPLKSGGLGTLAARLARALGNHGRKVSEAQLRLIMRRLTAEGVDDGFVTPRSLQERKLVEAFAAYTSLDPPTLASYLRSL